MDPLSALSVAAAVVQFVEFGFGLVKKASTIHKDAAGVREKIVEIDKISQELLELSGQIQERMALLQRPSGQLTVLEMRLLEACNNCKTMGGQLAEAIPKIQEKGVKSVNVGGPLGEPKNSVFTALKDGRSMFSNFRDALRLVLAEGRIVDLERNLETTKSTLMLTMISNLWERSTGMQTPSLEPSSTTTSNSETLKQQIQSESERQRFESFLHRRSEYMHHQDGGIPLSMEQQLSDVDCIESLLHQLNFGSLNTRHEAVPKAYEKTFSWIFERPNVSESIPDHLPWADFSEWLEHDSESVYWITGKPGSGKSTMMKYVCGDERLIAHLRNWSGRKPVYTVRYFSWNAGDGLQKSQEGMLRSLLYQIIQQRPQLALRLLPDRWAMLKIFGASAARDFPAWSYRELRDCMVSVKDLTNDFNLAIFIDGLDEFEGEHGQLIDFIKYLHCQPGMKVCVSSRPWNAFRDAFSGCPRLRMELLTKEDMEAFVQGKFETSVAIAELRHDQPTIADGLVADIVRKSEGVFLWVSLVTDSILGGIADGDTLADSYRLLNELPSDISDLYDSLWSRVRPEHKAERARMLCVLNEYSHSESEEYAKLKDDSYFFSRGLPQTLLWFSLSDPQASFSARPFARRLHSRTKGLVEIKPSGRVDYLHRTAHDWIMGRWDTIQVEVPADFDPHMALVTGLASSAHLADCEIGCCGDTYAWVFLAFHHFSRVAEKHRDRSFTELDRLADELRNTACKQVSAGRDRLRKSCWLFSSREGLNNLGFVTLAAAVGSPASQYVRTKIVSEPVYCTVEGNELDLIWPILLGAGPLSNIMSCPFLEKDRSAKRYCGNLKDRLDLAEVWIQCAFEETKDRAALLSKLTSRRDNISMSTYSVLKKHDGGRYKKEMLRILTRHGIGSSLEGRLRRLGFAIEDWFRR